MKVVFAIFILFVGLQSFEVDKFEIKGLWSVCSNSENCEEDESEFFMLFDDKEIQFFIKPGTGLDLVPLEKKAKYSIENYVLNTIEDEIITHFYIKKVSNREVNLISVEHKDTLFLTRVE